MRRLLVTRRVVPLDRVDEYHAAWHAVQAAATAAGARAWLFRRDGHEDQFLEFVESVGSAALDAAPLERARDTLDELFGRAESTEWEEAGTA